MTPRKGSTLGGTKIKLSGSGFGNCSNIEVNFEDYMTCDIKECSNTEIICITQKKGKTIQINNGGRHPVYGPGYVWSDREVDINPGDTIEWKWTLTVNSGETGISVHQVGDPTTNEYDGKGFKSEKSAKGRLRWKFDTPGIYYYSSQPVFGSELFMSGQIQVVADTVDITTSLSVTMEGIPAVQQIVSDTGSVAFPGCSFSGSTNCVADPTSTESFLFTMGVCMTPVVNTIDITDKAANFSGRILEGYNGAELTIIGQGFSDNVCQNVISIGDEHKCDVSSATTTQLVCNVNGTGINALPSLTQHKISVTVLNMGSALMAVPQPDNAVFFFVPEIKHKVTYFVFDFFFFYLILNIRGKK
jgi:plastocyanin